MNVLRHFFVGILAAAASPFAFGQEAAPRPHADSRMQNGASIPDFSGIWAHPYFPGFEPPASGPGPIVNRSRRARDGAGNANQFVAAYASPILKPQVAEAERTLGEICPNAATLPSRHNHS